MTSINSSNTGQPNINQTNQSEAHLNRDEFANPVYVDPNAKLPRIQALRGPSENLCGYFVSVDQMALAGWINFESSQLITYPFEATGKQEQGILLASPRMLVCPKSPVLAFDRKLTQESQNGPVILGRYTTNMKAEANYGNLQYFQVYLLDANNQPLHQVPLMYRATGANQATFAIHWQEFCHELETCHAIVNQIPARPKNSAFRCLGVFAFNTSRELAGDKQKSFACKVVQHEIPNLQNWRNYFVGFSPIKDAVWEGLEPLSPMLIPDSTQLPLTGGEESSINPSLPAGNPNPSNSHF
ncbi:DUF5895 domain-containing protein [Laspinema olomoucense]|uniref:DUF5895 domain-containing protein n=1 Tax=Laspinema olomoucense TaxID=3231600 RepID=UPI0021BB2D22|nr:MULTISPECIES: DUF5895 domain-containing protein [unclassified Laspinema]MCT7975832.1 DUF5895 domain-containing protein [Laspinema sp. D3d]MCT7996570.1 DUF5895 domain-containing protein [Laspinema sp. D3c]